MNRDLAEQLAGMADTPAKADLMNKMAMKLREKNPRETLELCNLALELSKRLSYTRGRAESLRTRGNCLLVLSEHDRAIADETEALRLFESLGDTKHALRAANIIGNIHRRTGDLRAAAGRFDQVLEQARAMDDKLMQASALNNLGNVHFAMNQEERATGYYQQAMALFRELGEVHYATMALINLSSIYRTSGQFQRALDCCREALTVFPECGDRQAEAATWFDMGLSYRDIGQTERAMEVWQKSIDIAREVGDVVTELSALVHTAEVLADPDHINECLELLGLAALLEPKIGDRKVRMSLHQVYAKACDIAGNPEEAEGHRRLCGELEGEIEKLRGDGK